MTAELLGGIAVLCTLIKAVAGMTFGRATRLKIPIPVEARAAVLPARAHRQRGFTMPELMVALGIAAILTAVAVPPLIAMVAAQRVKTATFDLYSAMSYARSEAIKRNAVVTITPRNGAFTNGYDLTTGGSTLRSQIGNPEVIINSPPGAVLAFDGYGRLTTPARYQLELSSGQTGVTPKRCLVIGTSGRPTIRVDTNNDGNCING